MSASATSKTVQARAGQSDAIDDEIAAVDTPIDASDSQRLNNFFLHKRTPFDEIRQYLAWKIHELVGDAAPNGETPSQLAARWQEGGGEELMLWDEGELATTFGTQIGSALAEDLQQRKRILFKFNIFAVCCGMLMAILFASLGTYLQEVEKHVSDLLHQRWWRSLAFFLCVIGARLLLGFGFVSITVVTWDAARPVNTRRKLKKPNVVSDSEESFYTARSVALAWSTVVFLACLGTMAIIALTRMSDNTEHDKSMEVAFTIGIIVACLLEYFCVTVAIGMTYETFKDHHQTDAKRAKAKEADEETPLIE